MNLFLEMITILRIKKSTNLSEVPIWLGQEGVELKGLVEETSTPQIHTLTQIQIQKTNLGRATQNQVKQTPAAPKQRDQNQAHQLTRTVRTDNQVNHQETLTNHPQVNRFKTLKKEKNK